MYSPFLAKRLCTVHSARLSMYLLLTVSFLFSSLTFPLIYHQNETMQNQKCSIRPEYKLLIRIYQPILMYGLPDLFLLANLFTVYALFDRHRQLSLINSHDERKSEIRINDLHSSRKQRQLTIMLITVSLSFYLFTTPAMVVYIAQFFPTKHRRLNKMKQDFIFSQISVLLLQLNNAVSCLVGAKLLENKFSLPLDEFHILFIGWPTISPGHSSCSLRILDPNQALLQSLHSLRQKVPIETPSSVSPRLHDEHHADTA